MSIDLTLDRVRSLASFLPPYTRPTCHIAGTNGKGSVSAFLSSILKTSSLSVGRFNSPHLISVHDCITINNQIVSADLYHASRLAVELADREHAIGASSFELLTMTALYMFERAKVDIAVVEVGMGGRLDATNVIPDESILISALTAVDLDHQMFLGNTVAEIASEKAAIARKNKPFVMGAQRHAEVEDVVRTVVARQGGHFSKSFQVAKRVDGLQLPPPSLVAGRFLPPHPQRVQFMLPTFPSTLYALMPLYGDYQLENLGLALAVLSALKMHPSCIQMLPPDVRNKITADAVCQGIRNTVWLGRLSFLEIPSSRTPSRPLAILVDGAHNPASATTLATYISHLVTLATDALHVGPNPVSLLLTYIVALSDSPPKTPLQTLSPLFPPRVPDKVAVTVKIAVLRFTPPEKMPWVKSVDLQRLRETVRTLMPDVDVWSPQDDEEPGQHELYRALNWASSMREEAQCDQALVVLAGSLYLVSDLYRMLLS